MPYKKIKKKKCASKVLSTTYYIPNKEMDFTVTLP